MANSLSIPVECQLTTAEQSREMDSKTIEEFGIDGFTLMELAANCASTHIKKLQGDDKKGLFICGKGNNAGDALAVARYLINDARHKAAIFFVLENDDLSPDTEKNLSLLKKLQSQGAEITFSDELEQNLQYSYDYLVDGIFGTGLNSDLRGSLPDVVNQINSSALPVYSMDVPSGLHADTGNILKACIKADYTFTFGSNKLGLHWNNARKYTGQVVLCTLPFPSAYRTWDGVLINKSLMSSLPGVNREAEHKYDGGVVHILAGSAGLTGAAIMSAKSAWKQGAGAVFLYAPHDLLSTYESVLPNIIKVQLGKESDAYLKMNHADTIIENIRNKPGVVLAGPGIGTRLDTGECLLAVLKEQKRDVILDADALSFWQLLHDTGISDQQKQKWLLTPHIGEASNYLNGEFNSDYERYLWAKKFTADTGLSLLIKGNPSILSIAKCNNFITGYDTRMFSRAGFGDVLSGALASYIAISGHTELAAISALYNGFEEFKNHHEKEPFGPEHLL